MRRATQITAVAAGLFAVAAMSLIVMSIWSVDPETSERLSETAAVAGSASLVLFLTAILIYLLMGVHDR